MIKRLAKQVLGRYYGPLVRMRHSEVMRFSLYVPLFPVHRVQQSLNPDIFAANICGAMGMGAVLTHAIKLARYAESCSKLPIITSTNSVYATHKRVDWLRNYIDTLKEAHSETRLHYLPVYNEYSYYGFGVPEHMEISEANHIFNKYFCFRPIILDRASEVMLRANVQEFDLSLHYRSTDKSSEAWDVSYNEVLTKVNEIAECGHPRRSIFLATDDVEFAAFIQKALPASQFTTFQLGTVDSGVPRHFSTLSGEMKAIEALVNMVLLSKSRACIRTCSYMSAWSKILNPELQVYTLNRLRKNLEFFPEYEVWMSEPAK